MEEYLKYGTILMNGTQITAPELTLSRPPIPEALACGTPVVATVVGGISEQVEEGVIGYTLPDDTDMGE